MNPLSRRGTMLENYKKVLPPEKRRRRDTKDTPMNLNLKASILRKEKSSQSRSCKVS
jgi:hypothetical protein